MRRIVVRLSILIACLFPVGFAAGEEVTLTATPTQSGYAIQVNGRPFAEYRYVGELTPDIWPVFSPEGKLATRSFPMADKEENEEILKAVRKVAPGESRDHRHHRSIWFHFGNVNGIDFWNIGPNRPYVRGQDAQILESSRDKVVLRSKNDWVVPAAQERPEHVVCQDVRTITFGTLSEKIWYIDFDVQVLAVDHEYRLTLLELGVN